MTKEPLPPGDYTVKIVNVDFEKDTITYEIQTGEHKGKKLNLKFGGPNG